jgi:hypothetical protein
VVAQHQAIGAGPLVDSAHLDVLTDQARLDAAQVADGALLEHHRVLDLGG